MRKKFLLFLPIIIWALLCASEWYMWANPPLAFFFQRGHTQPNLDYTAVTRGDLVAGNIFVTPVPRLCRYITDKYSNRNTSTSDKIDVLMVGDSFAWGAGNSHEDTPAVQLEKIMGKTVRLPPSGQNLSGIEVATLLLKEQKLRFNTLLYLIMDGDLLEPVYAKDWDAQVEEISINGIAERNSYEDFKIFKKYVSDYSPHAILARKMKTSFKKNVLTSLYNKGVFQRSSRTLEFLDHDGNVLGFRKLPKMIANFDETNSKLNQILKGFEALNDYAREKNVHLVIAIIPRKNIAYRKYLTNPSLAEGYGPGVFLKRALEGRGIEVVFPHSVIFKAVEEEIERGGPFVYWGDDTHWGPYGIRLVMEKVKEKLDELYL